MWHSSRIGRLHLHEDTSPAPLFPVFQKITAQIWSPSIAPKSNKISTEIATPTVLENFPDIDECLETRARAVIELAAAISLKEGADKAEERQLSSEVSNDTNKTAGCRSPISSYNKPTESDTPTKYQPNEIEKWKQPESIAEVVEMLDFCEDAETLALIRRGRIPSEVFKIAARSLPQQKREQIRQWVIAQNAA